MQFKRTAFVALQSHRVDVVTSHHPTAAETEALVIQRTPGTPAIQLPEQLQFFVGGEFR
jgi:hypothetical protein